MRGIISESHFDSGRNMIAMIKGSKRYILNPPQECSKLGIITNKKHPSYRHSIIDWSSTEQVKNTSFCDIKAIQTVVKEGEMLYIPSFWFHYIVSLDYSIQCNSRSGLPPNGQGKNEINKCLGGNNFPQRSKHKKKRHKMKLPLS